MKKLTTLLLLTLLTVSSVWADVEINTTNFPDENFRIWLGNQSYGADGVLTDTEIGKVKQMNVSSLNILNLQGIEFFTALTNLNCNQNKLTSLDVSKNTALIYLRCFGNQLTSLNVSGCTALKELYCLENQLTALDVSGCTALTELYCEENSLTSLDVSGCSALTYIECQQNKIKGADMTALVSSLPTVSSGTMRVLNNSNEQNVMLTTQVAAAKDKGWTPVYYDGRNWQEYAGSEPEPIAIDATNFPDEGFRTWLLMKSYGADGKLTEEEIAAITEIDISYQHEIRSIQGIEFFTALKVLEWYECFGYSVDLSKNTELESLSIDGGNLREINLSKNTKLANLVLSSNYLTSLDVSNNTALRLLECYRNQIKGAAMDALVASLPEVSSGTMRVLYNINEQNEMTTTQVAAAKAKGWTPYYYYSGSWQEYAGSDLEAITIDATNFPDEAFRTWLLNQSYGADGKLTEEEIASVTEINISYNRYIKSIQGIEFFTALKELEWYESMAYSVDLSKNTALERLEVSHSGCTSLDLSKNTALKYLSFYNSEITSLDLSKNTALTTLYCHENQLTSLNVSGCTALKELYCYQNQIKGAAMDALVASLPNVSSGTMRVLYNNSPEQNEMTTVQVAAAKAKGWTAYYTDDYGSHWEEYAGSRPESITIDATNFPDANFRNYLLGQSYGFDGKLTAAEVAAITEINVSSRNIQSLKGIEYFDALTSLNCGSNKLTALDVSMNTALTTLNCYQNQIKGAAMDALVASLPKVSSGAMYVIINNENEGNVMLTTQVAEAKAKGWTVYAWDGDNWKEHAGIESIRGDANGDGKITIQDAMFIVNHVLYGKYPDE